VKTLARLDNLERQAERRTARARQGTSLTPHERRTALLSILGYSMERQAEMPLDEKRAAVAAIVAERNRQRQADGEKPLVVEWNER